MSLVCVIDIYMNDLISKELLKKKKNGIYNSQKKS